jgi:hypothetical protein
VSRRHAAALGALALVLGGACSLPGSGATPSHSAASASRSATPSTPASAPPSPAPSPLIAAYGVLMSPLTTTNYTVSLVGGDGRVIASAQASTPSATTCANAAAAVVSAPVSASNTRVYYMDALGVVRYLAPNGDAGRATAVPIGPSRRSMFAVSPDDQRIAVVVDDFTASGASTRLYVEDLNGGGHHADIFGQTGGFTLWPTGWHGTNNLIVAKVPSCTQGGGPGTAGPTEFHVVDPATAIRRFTVGGPGCLIAGAPSPAGAVCESDVQATVVTWTAVATRAFTIQGFTPAYLSPDGSQTATLVNGDTVIQESSKTFPGIQACGWIDDTHIFSGGDAQRQPRVVDTTTGNVVPIAAQGDCVGRLPGGL